VLRQEYLEEDLQNMLCLENIQINTVLPHLRKSASEVHMMQLTPEPRAAIESLYEEDIAMLNQFYINGYIPFPAGDK